MICPNFCAKKKNHDTESGSHFNLDLNCDLQILETALNIEQLQHEHEALHYFGSLHGQPANSTETGDNEHDLGVMVACSGYG